MPHVLEISHRFIESHAGYCIDTTYSSGQVTRDVLEGIENSSKP